MNEYVVFDPALRDRFLAFLGSRGLPYDVRPDTVAGFVVSVPDDLDDALDDAVETAYEALMVEQRDLTESDAEARSLMAVQVELADGRALSVRLPARYARRLHQHFSIDEISGLVTEIAEDAINPPSGPLCGRT